MAAQIEAIATNSVLPLKMFSGDDAHTEDGSFDQWLEQLEDRAKAANWNDNQKLFQLNPIGKNGCSCCANDAKQGASQVNFCCFDVEEEKSITRY